MNRSTILLLLLSTPSPTRAQTSSSSYPTSTYVALMSNDTLINADLWDETPQIFTANYAFEGIQGVEDMTQAGVEAAGGSWYAGPTCNLTTAQSPSAGRSLGLADELCRRDACGLLVAGESEHRERHGLSAHSEYR